MKIKTYKDSEVFDIFASYFIKQATPTTELGQEIIKILDDLVEAGIKLSPQLVDASKALQESVSLAAKDTDDAMNWLAVVVDEFARLNKALAEGSLLDDLAETQAELAKVTRSRNYLLQNWRKLKNHIPEIEKNYQEAIDLALREKGASQATVSKLSDEVDLLTNELKAAKSSVEENIQIATDLTGKLKASEDTLSQTTKQLADTTSELEKYKSQYGELIEKYEKLIAESDAAAKQAQAAKQAGAPQEVVEGLEEVAKTKKQSADSIATAVTKGDDASKAALEAEATAKVKTPSSPAKNVPDKPPSGYKEVVNESFKSGLGENIKNIAKTTTLGTIIGTVIKGGLGLALVGFLGYQLWYNGPSLWSSWTESDEEEAKRTSLAFDAILREAHKRLSAIQFKPNTNSITATQSYLSVMQMCFGLVPEMNKRFSDNEFIIESGKKIQVLAAQTENYIDLSKDVYQLDLASTNGWDSALIAIGNLKVAIESLLAALQKHGVDLSNTQEGRAAISESSTTPKTRQRPEPDPNDKGIDVLGKKVFLSQYPEIDPATRSAAPYLIQKVLLSPTGLSFWDPENKWGGGYLQNTGTIADQVIRHVRFFMNPRAIDSDWAYGPINNQGDLKKFMRKNLPKASRKHDSGYKSTRREYRRKQPKLASNTFSQENMDFDMKNREKRLEILNKIANSTNNTDISMKNMTKAADSVSKQFYQDALKGLDDQYAKSYLTGLKSMYDEKPKADKADYKKLYEVFKETGADLVQQSHSESVNLADAKGRGGVVENGLEQQRHNIGVALSTPTGNFRGKHSALLETLKKIANSAESDNKLEESKLVLETLNDIKQFLK